MRPIYKPTQMFLNIVTKFPNTYQFCKHYDLNPDTIDRWLRGVRNLSRANRAYIAIRTNLKENQVAL